MRESRAPPCSIETRTHAGVRGSSEETVEARVTFLRFEERGVAGIRSRKRRETPTEEAT